MSLRTATVEALDVDYLRTLSLDDLAELLTTWRVVLRSVSRVPGIGHGERSYVCVASRMGTVVSVHGGTVLGAIVNALGTGARQFDWFNPERLS